MLSLENEQDLSKRSRETLKMKKVYTESSTGCVCECEEGCEYVCVFMK